MNYRIIPNPKEEIAPATLLGTMPFPVTWSDYEWFNELPKNTYFALWLRNPSQSNKQIQLPTGHDLYVVTFHYEHLDCEWVMDQASRITQPIIVLNDGSTYDFPWPDNVHFYNIYSWHNYFDQIMTWFPQRQKRNLKYKISAVCNRITQSKLLVTTALLENFPQQDLLIKLGAWLEEKNVHHRKHCGNAILDQLSDIFFAKYYGKEIQIDDFKDATHNFHRVNGNPWQPLYIESAIHITNESYHYSYMNDGFGNYIRPGPMLSEKTFKCLLAQTPFISAGQFDVYDQLAKLGLIFDYGPIDLTWDRDPGNLSRISKTIESVLCLKDYDLNEIDIMTKNSSAHNAEYIWSGAFFATCRSHNQAQAEIILSKFG